MSIVHIVKTLEARNVQLSLVDGKLRTAAPKGAISDDLAQQIRSHKADLIEFLHRRDRASEFTAIDVVDHDDPVPASFQQRRLWFIDQLEGGSRQYHISTELRLLGSLNITAFRSALDFLIERHEALRTVFFASDDNTVMQAVRPPAPMNLDIRSASNVPGDARRQMLDHANRPFDLADDQMIRGMLIEVATDEHLLLLTMHHIASDGWSRGILVKELAHAYAQFSAGEQPNPTPLRLQYRDYSVWQTQRMDDDAQLRHLDYWKRELSGIHQLHSLPLDYPRPPRPPVEGRRLKSRVSRDLLDAMKRLQATRDVTLFMLLETAFAVLVSRWSNEEDIVIGCPVANRQRSEVAGLIGFFANTVALRNRVPGDESFVQLLDRTRSTVQQAFAHIEVPFEHVVEAVNPQRSLSHAPVFQIMFSLQNNERPAADMNGLTIETMARDEVATKFDLELNMSESQEGLSLTWLYPSALFRPDTIERLNQGFVDLLRAVVAHPETPVGQLDLLSDVDRRLLEAWNSTASPVDSRSVVERIHDQVRAHPSTVAVCCNGVELTYGELWERSGRAATQLRKWGIRRESLVAVCARRSENLIVALVAVFRVGAAFVSLDPAYPSKRLRDIASSAQPDLVINDGSYTGFDGQETVELDALFEGESVDEAHQAPTADDLAYVIYTSGSTGEPKGVEIRHQSLCALIDWAENQFDAGELARVLVSTSLNFDLSIFEIFVPLCTGTTCVVVTDALALLEQPVDVTLINTVPSAIRALLDANAVPSSAIAVNLAGEPLPGETVNALLEETGCKVVRNLYGPSEDTTYSTWARFTAPVTAPPSIGVPVSNTTAWVLNAYGQQVPVGAVGELHLGGAGLAAGYRQRPDLTQERFVDIPVGRNESPCRVYRTGDLVRFDLEGQLHYLGRVDDQLKLRGFRIEPGEIEHALRAVEGIQDVAVIVRGEGDARFLAAFVTASSPISDEDIRSRLGLRLPDYMVPSAIVILDQLPLTANGKINKRVLASMDLAINENVSGPETQTEHVVARVWEEVLGRDLLDVTQNFFALGGHSLLATKISAALTAESGAQIPLRAVFEYPTVRALARHLDTLSTRGENHVIQPAPRGGPLPLSFSQQRMWFYDHYDGESTQYNMPYALRLRGKVSRHAIHEACTYLVRRHEILRTVYREEDGIPSQHILSNADITVGERKIAQAQVEAAVRREACKRFDLAHDLPLRVSVLSLGDDEHILLFTLHHIAGDGWSLGILIREFASAYAALSSGASSIGMAPPSLQYADFAFWQRNSIGRHDQSLEYWRRQLADIPAVHNLPTDRPRPAEQEFSGARLTRTLPVSVTDRLAALGQEHQCSLFMVVAAAYSILLYRWNSEQEVVIGTTVSGRDHDQLQSVVGCFVNTVLLRFAPETRDESFARYLARARQTILDAFAHQSTPFEHLVDELKPQRSLSHPPLFQVMLSSGGFSEEGIELVGLDAAPLESSTCVAKFDLDLAIARSPEGLKLNWVYATSLFDRSTIERFSESLEKILTAVAQDPAAGIHSFPWVPNEDLSRIDTLNQTEVAVDGQSLPERLSHYAEHTPDSIAVRFGAESVTYEQLYARAERVAAGLRYRGIACDDVIAIACDRGIDLFVALYGVWLSGGTVLPLDNTLPADRIAFMLEDSGAKLTIGTGSDEESSVGMNSVGLSDLELTVEPNRVSQEPGHLAYVIYTSGSTGAPKGVLVSHRALSVKLEAWRELYDLSEKRVHLQMASFSFDVFMGDVARSLGCGATLVQCPRDVLLEPAELWELIDTRDVDIAEFVPAVLRELMDHCLRNGRDLRQFAHLIVGSDVWNGMDHQRARSLVGPAAVIANSYGLTECGIDSTCFIDGGEETIADTAPIGRPLTNTRLYVLDGARLPVAFGVSGELFIGGDGLADGYLNRPDLDRERFVPDPWCPGQRMYRTGDVTRFRRDGQLEFSGRNDHQIKIRGFRVEPGEIEAALQDIESVARCVVTGWGKSMAIQLVAYVVLGEDATQPTDEGIRQVLQQKLPAHMVPTHIVRLNSMPLSANGKVDRKALPDPEIQPGDHTSIPPCTADEETLVNIWQDVLGVQPIGVHDNFFAIGGDSILAIQVVSRANSMGMGLSARKLFEHQTVAELARCVERQIVRSYEQGDLAGDYPLLPMQHRFFRLPDDSAHHDNQSVLLRIPAEIDAAAMRDIATALLCRHDILRSTFPCNGAQSGRVWRVHAFHDEWVDRVFHIVTGPLRGPFETACDVWQKGLNLEEGPLFRIVLFAESRQLLLVAHHLIIDAVSWRILLQDLQTAAQQFDQGLAITLPPKTASAMHHAACLKEWAHSEAGREARMHWLEASRSETSGIGGRDLETIPDMSTTCYVTARLDQGLTQKLLSECNLAFGTRITELLVAGLARALRDWNHVGRVRIDMEAHGRDGLLDDLDVSDSLGWFTALYPVVVQCQHRDLHELIKSVKSNSRSLPDDRAGYGALAFSADSMQASPYGEVVFNYLGQLDQTLSEDSGFSASGQGRGQEISPNRPREHRLGLNGAVVNGELGFRIDYSNLQFDVGDMERFASCLENALTEIVGLTQGVRLGHTPEDFPLVSVRQKEVDKWFDKFGPIKAIYPATPMQLGMLYHSLADRGLYVTQTCPTLVGDLDVEAFGEAWKAVLAQHDALRTVFVRKTGDPCQLVVERCELPMRVLDWSALKADDLDARFEALCQSDKESGFDLDTPPLIRLTIVRTAHDRHRILWTHHHMLLDGWSTPEIYRDVLQAYTQIAAGRSPELPRPKDYSNYASWLAQRSSSSAIAYWKNYLSDCSPVETGLLGKAWNTPGTGHAEKRYALSREATNRLTQRARESRCTVNTLLQLAWALTIARFNGTKEAMFGATISGRPADVEGMDSMVGLFINTIPVRVRFDREDLDPLLRVLHEAQQQSTDHGFLSLSQVRKAGGIGADHGELFDNLVVFENFPVDAAIEGHSRSSALTVEKTRNVEQTNYPFTIGADLTDQLRLKVGFWQSHLDHERVDVIMACLQETLERLPSAKTVSDLLPAEPRVLNGETTDIPQFTLMQSVYRVATSYPEHAALMDTDGELTYSQLVAEVTRIQQGMQDRGVCSGDRVLIALPRGKNAVICMLAANAIGAAFVPADPANPQARLTSIIEACAPSLIVGDPSATRDAVALDDLRRKEPASPCFAEYEPDAICYVLFTSGSTGRPKGVAVRHSSLNNLGQALHRMLGSSTVGMTWALNAAFTFDASLQAISQLAWGARCAIVDEEDRRDPSRLESFLRRIDADVLDGTPSHLSALLDFTQIPPVRHLVLGGEGIGQSLWERLRQIRSSGAECRAWNVYGPTEACVDSTFCPIDDAHVFESIGEPMPNVLLEVRDAFGSPTPAGGIGELLIGGAGLADGYEGDEIQTRAQFVGEGLQRRYRTGDLIRVGVDGALQFVRRADAQMKLRGVRIEPAEIVSGLERIDGVVAAAVRIHETGNVEQLLGYVVCSRTVAEAELMDAARHQLPASMLPSSIVRLERLPLTASGKLDVAALPVTIQSAPSAPAAAFGPVHAALVDIWEAVLGVDDIGLNDNFFALGGDSILAIAVVARASEAGFPVTARMLLEAPTVGALAAALCDVDEVSAAPTPAIGEQILLPVAKDFLEVDDPHRNHFNQSLFLHDLDCEVADLRAAVRAIVQRHDALRLTFQQDESGSWDARYIEADREFLDQCVVVETVDDAAQGERCQYWQKRFDLATGPLIRFVVFPRQGRLNLALIAHHLVVDAVSWQLILADLRTCIDQRSSAEPIALAARPPLLQEWAARCDQTCSLRGADALFWAAQFPPQSALRFKADSAETTVHDHSDVEQLTFSESQTKALVDVARNTHSSLQEVVLSALSLAARRAEKVDFLQIDLEGHGREALFDDLDVSRTVGWFTTVFPLCLRCDVDSRDLVRALTLTKESLRSIPGKGLSFGWLQRSDGQLAAMRREMPSPVLFNFLGVLDRADATGAARMGGAGEEVSRNRPRSHPLIINCHIVGGSFQASFGYANGQIRQSRVAALIGHFSDVLAEMAALDRSRLQAAWMPEDVCPGGVSRSAFEKARKRYSDIENVFSLSPMQQGLYFHNAVDPRSYILQSDLSLTGSLNVSALRDAYDDLVLRHPSLRSAFLAVGDDESSELIQVVRRDAKPRWEYLEVNDRSEIEGIVEALCQRASTGFDLAAGCPMRVDVLRVADDEHRLIWTYHHLITDGWSMPILFQDLMQAYQYRVGSAPAPAAPIGNYSDYASWLYQQDEEKAQEYWRQYLQGVDAPNEWATTGSTPQSVAMAAESCSLDEDESTALRSVAKKLSTTPGALLQLAWAVVLQRYCGSPEALFGVTVSGRPPAVNHVDALVGLFINTLPVRLSLEPRRPLSEVVHALQSDLQQSMDHGYLPLAAIQKCSEIQRGSELFDSVVVFENFPVQAAAQSASSGTNLRVQSRHATERTHYAVTVIAHMDDCLHIDLVPNGKTLAADTLEQMASHLIHVLKQIPHAKTLADLHVLRSDERQALSLMNATHSTYARSASIDALVEAQMLRVPGRAAVTDSDGQWTYEELWQAAGRFASALHARGVRRGDLVGICMPRGREMIGALLGTLRAGAGYVPLDIAYPADRIAFMIADSSVSQIITTPELAEQLQVDAERCLTSNAISADQTPIKRSHHGDDRAYVLYTSGSTGQPKGVQIRHRNASALIHWARSYYTDDELRCVLASTSLNFDLSVFEMFVPLCLGHSVHVVDTVLALAEQPAAVSMINTVPSAMRALLQAGCVPDCVETVNLAGEPLPAVLVNELLTGVGGRPHCKRVCNLYGPSEDTTYSTAASFTETLDSPPAIGSPISNTRAHVVDDWGRSVPPGVAGELYLSGEGVAAGYLNRPELTKDRFVSVDIDGQRTEVYRTGDLVRWSLDGSLHFVGRSDDQVKLRGYRIELGEIQHQIEHCSWVREAVVIVTDVHTRQALVAHCELKDAPEGWTEQLQVLIGARLPAYMVPSVWLAHEALPRTPNGKVDRRALHGMNMDFRPSAAVDDALSDLEREMLSVWQAVLRVSGIGLDDNYFGLGGDSIVALQLVSVARERNIDISVAQIFEFPTPRTLCREASWITVQETFAPASGHHTLLPIQRWLLDANPVDLHHYNQSVLLALPDEFNAEGLEHICAALVQRHDALRLRFVRLGDRWHAEYEPWNATMCKDVFVVDESVDIGDARALRTRCDHWQRTLNLSTGPVFRAVLFADGTTNRLLLIGHHLAVDGVSWRIIRDDISRLHQAWQTGETLDMDARSSASYQQFAKTLWNSRHIFADQKDYWLAQLKPTNERLPMDFEADCPLFESSRTVGFNLNAEATAVLLRRSAKTGHASVQDVLVSALAKALAEWSGAESVRIDLESHGREALGNTLPVHDTVGWFTTLYPLRLTDLAKSGNELIRSVASQASKVLHNGAGFGVLRYLCRDPELVAADRTAPVVFNYLGQMGSIADAEDGISGVADGRGAEVSPDRPREHPIGVNCMVAGDRFLARFDYSTDQFASSTMDRLVSAFEAVLNDLLTRSDETLPTEFALTTLSTDQIDTVADSLEQRPSSIYPATALQRGMYFHSLLQPGMYVTQIYPTLSGDLDVTCFRQAWAVVTAKYEPLRSAFFGDASNLHQVCIEQCETPWHFEDWSDRTFDEAERDFEAYRVADRNAGFALDQPPLHRVAVFRLASQKYRILWSHHHMLLDGWSTPMVFADVIAAYRSLLAGRSADIGRAQSPEAYYEWLAERDTEAACAYWRKVLGNFDSPNALTLYGGRSPGAEGGRSAVSRVYDAVLWRRLREFARENNCTVNHVIQLAWAHLVARYSGSLDVVFGMTHSGRPAEVPESGSLVGMFINTIPVRIRLQPGQTIANQLQALQQCFRESSEHNHLALIDIQQQSGVPAGGDLFESLLIFENYPVDMSSSRSTQTDDALSIESAGNTQQSNYPLTISIDGGSRLEVTCGYDGSRYSRQDMECLLDHLGILLSELPATASLDRVNILGESAFDQWCDLNSEPIPGNARSLLDLVAWGQGAEHTALVDSDTALTYSELMQRMERLDYALRGAGVTPGDVIGIHVERSVDLVVAMLGVLRCGAACMPLLPGTPDARISEMIGQVTAPLVLVDSSNVLLESAVGETQVLRIDEVVQNVPSVCPPVSVNEDDIAFVFFTSGTSGTPKGVAVPHRALINHVIGKAHTMGLSGDVRGLQNIRCGFDPSVFEIFAPLYVGGRVVLPKDEVSLDGDAMAQWIERHGITCVSLTPVQLGALVSAAGERDLSSLQHISVGGEALSLDGKHAALGALPGVHLWNAYGPTEAGVEACSCDLSRVAKETVPLGRAHPGYGLHVVDVFGNPAAAGVSGELLISGRGLAKGYVGRDDLTVAAYTTLACADLDRVYRTGDFVHWRGDGLLYFEGRRDTQIKIRGMRVEIGEIEAVIRSLPEVGDVAVITRPMDSGESSFMACMVPTLTPVSAEAAVEGVRAALASRLPAHMQPSNYLWLDSGLPTTPSGKLDVAALRELTPLVSHDYVVPEGDTESIIADLWATLLGVSDVSAEADFFMLGGHSLMVTRLANQLAERFSIVVELGEFLHHRTVRAQAAWVDTLTAEQTLRRDVAATTASDAAAQKVIEI